MWFKYSENQMVKSTLDGWDIIQAVWLDTCPYDSSKEYCVCKAHIEYDAEVIDFESAEEYFQENCCTDSYVVKDECTKEEALEFIQEWIHKHK